MRAAFPKALRRAALPTVDDPILMFGLWPPVEFMVCFLAGLLGTPWVGYASVGIALGLLVALQAMRPLLRHNALVHALWRRGLLFDGTGVVGRSMGWPRSPFRSGVQPRWRP